MNPRGDACKCDAMSLRRRHFAGRFYRMEFGLQECMLNIQCHGKRAKGVLAFMPWMRKKGILC